MSFTPFDWEREEELEARRHAPPHIEFPDTPDPSEYRETFYPHGDDDMEANEVAMEVTYSIADDYMRVVDAEFVKQKPGMIDENAPLRGLLAMLFGALVGLMLWILIGAAVVRFFRWAF